MTFLVGSGQTTAQSATRPFVVAVLKKISERAYYAEEFRVPCDLREEVQKLYGN